MRTLRIHLFVLLTLASLYLLPISIDAQQRDTTLHLRPRHREVVQQWLARSGRGANLRVATEKDCLNESGLAATRREQGKSYQPYYVVGDFNRDRREDFAVAFVNDRRRQRKFTFVIFNGPFGNKSVPEKAIYRRTGPQSRAASSRFGCSCRRIRDWRIFPVSSSCEQAQRTGPFQFP